MSEPQGEPGGLAEGTLISHLLELRDRLLKAMLAVGICFIPCAMYMNQLFTFIAQPLIRKLPAGASIQLDDNFLEQEREGRAHMRGIIRRPVQQDFGQFHRQLAPLFGFAPGGKVDEPGQAFAHAHGRQV